ncbi:hypothetical protein PIB30_057989 [Stylosanthes scabra]|uniref:Uncharacterized protein n=1 Tax=Stylosanthes scabra TaxID=79078 RepID=A0ABU6WI23_9FABA|nr:hypothetical protein [Stylosanthes scabra]
MQPWRRIFNSIEQMCKAASVGQTSSAQLRGPLRNAYNMVLHKFGETLYSGLVATMTGHLKEIAKSVEAA